MELDSHSIELAPSENQYILTQVGTHRVAFPAEAVAGILLVERSQILALPFYHEVVLGIAHHQGQIVTLMMFQQLLDGSPGQSREVFNAVQLSEQTGTPSLGLIIDQLLGNCTEEQVSTDATIRLFQPDMLDPDLWKPQRWVSLTH